MVISNYINLYKLSGITFTGTSTELNYNAGVTQGIATANKALVVDTNKDILNINTLGITNATFNTITGTLTTPMQSNITSVGTLDSLSVNGNATINTEITWTQRTSAANNNWQAICWSPQLLLFVAVSDSGTGNRVMTSPDAIAWTIQTSAANNNWHSVCWSSELLLFVAVSDSGTGNRVMTSSNGINWTSRTSAADNNWHSVCWSSELLLFVAVSDSGTGNRVMTSSNGINWTTRTSAADNNWQAVCWSPDLSLFVAVSNSGVGNQVMTSPDGINWTIGISPFDNLWNSVCWSRELTLFVAIAFNKNSNQSVMTSPDGINWTVRTAIAMNWKQIIWVYELAIFIAIAYSGPGSNEHIMYSKNGINWFPYNIVHSQWTSIAWSPELNIFAAVSTLGNNIRALSGIDNNNFQLNGVTLFSTGTQLNYADIAVNGYGQANRALVLNTTRNINNINSTQLNQGIIDNLYLNNILVTSSVTELNYNTLSVLGTAEASKTLITNSSTNISNINSLIATNIYSSQLTGILQTAIQSNITSVGTLSSLTMNGAINSVNNINITSNLSGATTISADNISGTVQTASQPNIIGLGTLTNLNTTTANLTTLDTTTFNIGGTQVLLTANKYNYNGVIPGISEALKSLVCDSSRNINSGLNSLTTTSLITTNINGIIQTTSQSNITSVGLLTSLNISGSLTANGNFYITQPNIYGQITGCNILSINNIFTTLGTTAQPNITNIGTISSLYIVGKLSNGYNSLSSDIPVLNINSPTGDCLRLSYNAPSGAATVYSDFTISDTGITTIAPSGLYTYINSDIVIGSNATENMILFSGVTNDSGLNYTNISERLYNGNNYSELYLFKGNDQSEIYGPDRIRLRSAEILFQQINNLEDSSTIFDNNTKFSIKNNGLIGINNTNPTYQLDIISTNGNCFNINNGFSDLSLKINATGECNIISSVNSINFGNSSNLNNKILIFGSTTSSSGILRFLNFTGTNYIQSGLTGTSGSSTDLCIVDMGNTTNSARKFIYKSDGKVGIQTFTPGMQLEINNPVGNMLSLIYNNSKTFNTNITSVGNIQFNLSEAAGTFIFSGGNISGTIDSSQNEQLNITSTGTLSTLNISGPITTNNLTINGNINSNSNLKPVTAAFITGAVVNGNQTNITNLGILTTQKIKNTLKLGTLDLPNDMLHIESLSNSYTGIRLENRNSTAGNGTQISFRGYKSAADYMTWAIRSSAVDNNWLSVCWSSELYLFVAVANTGTGDRVMTSPDGINWTIRTSAADNSWRGICWSPELYLFVAVAYTGTGNRVMTSPDGINWTSRTSAADNSWYSVCWSPELYLFVAVANTGTGNRVMTSPNGINWTSQTSAADNSWYSICWSPELYLFVAVAYTGTGNRVMTSPNGINWTSRSSATDNDWLSVCWSPELYLFVAVANTGTGNRVMTSPNGINWTSRSSAVDNNWISICWSPELRRFSAVANTGTGNRVMTAYGRLSHELVNISNIATTSDNPTQYQYGSLVFKTRNTYNDANLTERLRITNTGNIGINTSSPSYLLDVNGITRCNNLYINSNLLNLTFLDSSIANTTYKSITLGKSNTTLNQGYFSYYHTSDGSTSNRLVLRTSTSVDALTILGTGKVGINTSTINTNDKLTINGNLTTSFNTIDNIICDTPNIGFTVGNQVQTQLDAINGIYSMGTINASDFNLRTSGGSTFIIKSTGACGYNTTSPSYKFYASNNVGGYGPLICNTFSGSSSGTFTSYSFSLSSGWNNTSFSSRSYAASFGGRLGVSNLFVTSDRRIKDDIMELEINYCKEFILKTIPKQFKYKNDDKNDISLHFGYIAQDLLKLGYNDFITIIKNEELEEYIDDDGFICPAKAQLNVTLDNVLPIIAKNIKHIYNNNESYNNKLNIIKEYNLSEKLTNNLSEKLTNKIQNIKNKNIIQKNKLDNYNNINIELKKYNCKLQNILLKLKEKYTNIL